jgi:hypothetical protein
MHAAEQLVFKAGRRREGPRNRAAGELLLSRPGDRLAAQIQARLAEEAKNLSATDNGQAMAACANAMVKRADELATATDPKPVQPEGR